VDISKIVSATIEIRNRFSWNACVNLTPIPVSDILETGAGAAALSALQDDGIVNVEDGKMYILKYESREYHREIHLMQKKF
jgi:hypothetical protein